MSFLQYLGSILKKTAIHAIEPMEAAYGLLKDEKDERDWKYEVLRDEKHVGAGYLPKNKRVLLKTVSIKDQRPYNTCTFASAVAQKEIDEGVELSLRSLVCFARSAGYITGNGYSSLRNAQQALINFGAAEAKLLKEEPKTNWEIYANSRVLQEDVKKSASTHKAKSSLLLTSISDWFHALDNGRAIQTGCKWFTGYNSLPEPYVLPIGRGVSVGGHAFVCIGYDMTQKIFIFQNSFGPSWGDKCLFYVRFADFSQLYQGRLTVDIPDMANKVAASYEGKDIKTADDPRIYRVEGGKKRVFTNEKVFFSWGGRFGTDKTWVLVSSQIMNAIPEGQPMTLKP